MNARQLLITTALALALAGCGSGGGGTASIPTLGGSPPASSSPAVHHKHKHHHHHHHQTRAVAPGHGCDAALWAHVYHPDRLHVVDQCKTVRGTVTKVEWEPDGDLHIRLATRPALVNSVNDQYQAGDLVLEEICQGTVSQADAEAACAGVPHD